MNYININSILLGLIYSICILSINLFYCLLCRFFKIKILEFSIFTSFKSFVHQDKIGNIIYKLGWFPFGSSIKPLGKIKHEEYTIEKKNLKYAYYLKPKYVHVIFTLMTSIFYLILILITFLFLIKNNFDLQEIINYLINGFSNIFNNSYNKSNFIIKTQELLYNKNIIVFEILILLIFQFILSLLEKLANWSSSFKNKSILSKTISWLVIATIVYFVYWKVPNFLLSFFSIKENFIFILNFLIGVFILGYLLYFLIIIFLKATEKTNIDIRIKVKETDKKTNINEVFDQLYIFSTKDLINRSITELLIETNEYLKYDIKNIDTKFSINQFKLDNKIKYHLANKGNGIKKYLPFLITSSEKINNDLLNEISILFDKKNDLIKSFYNTDILIVEEFLVYATQKLKIGELFFYESAYKEALWTKKEFPRNMFNYLAYQIRTNPEILTTKYIEDMKEYFSLIGLSIDDEEKTKKANHYFTKTKNPFSFNIPERYEDVSSEIQMAVVVMSGNQKLIEQITNDVIKRYGE